MHPITLIACRIFLRAMPFAAPPDSPGGPHAAGRGKLTAAGYYHRGNASFERNDYESAIDDYTRAIALDPRHADAHVARARAYDRLAQPERALADYERAIALEPKSARAAAWREAVRMRRGEAAASDDSAPDAETHTQRGHEYAEDGRYDRAIAEYSRAIALDGPRAPAGVYFARGMAYDDLGDAERAIADFSRVIELDPAHTAAHQLRGRLHLSRGDYARAVADFSWVIEREPASATHHYVRGIAYASLRQNAEAIRDLETFMRLAQQQSLVFDRADVERKIRDLRGA